MLPGYNIFIAYKKEKCSIKKGALIYKKKNRWADNEHFANVYKQSWTLEKILYN